MEKYIPFFQGEKRSITERLADYFEQSDLNSKIHYDEDKEAYILSVPADKEKEAKKLYQDFYFNERERVEQEEKNNDFLKNYDESNMLTENTFEETYSNKLQEAPLEDNTDFDEDSSVSLDGELNIADTTETEENAEKVQPEPEDEDGSDKDGSDDKAAVRNLLSGSSNYVFKAEKYNDYTGTLYIFLFMGIAGIIFVILNITKVLTVLNGFFPNFIMGALFLFFIYEGISTGRKAQKLKAEIEEENQLSDKINQWLRKNVTEDFLASISNEELSEELDYIKKTDTIRDMLISEFGEQNPDYLDRLIEEFYSETFDTYEVYTEADVKIDSENE